MVKELDLKPYYKLGFSLLQWALIIGGIGLALVGLHELLMK